MQRLIRHLFHVGKNSMLIDVKHRTSSTTLFEMASSNHGQFVQFLAAIGNLKHITLITTSHCQ